MDISLTSNNILFTITIAGVMFAIYRSYRDPQTSSERTDAVMGVRIDNLQTAMDKILSNHLPHLDAKIEDIHADVSQLKTTVTQLATVIEERIPRRKGE